MSDTRPIRVAIVGGGCAGMTTAFELSRPEHRGRYAVTVYQSGWRLGGKGASGRGPAGRIEEHGLHFWMGFYDNAFRLMRECYAELGRDPARCPIADWRDAFAPAETIGVTEQTADGGWLPWFGNLPRPAGLPGDPVPPGLRWTMAEYARRIVDLLRTLVGSLASHEQGRVPGSPAPRPADESVLDRIARFLHYGELATLGALAEAVAVLEVVMGSVAQYPDNVVLRFLDAVATGSRSQLEAAAATDPEVRRLWTLIDVALASLRGMVRFGLFTDPRGFDAIDEYDCREWLLLNGASPQSVHSAYMRGLYDLVFAYEDADPQKPRTSAGQALRGMARAFFNYRGAFFWTMQAGMGDVVFAPLYEVLAARGVRFEFFHRLENVRLVDPARLLPGETPYVEALEFDVQAEVAPGRTYAPLVDVGGLPCWPAEPHWDQLTGGDRQRREAWDFESFWDRRRVRPRTLWVGDDFDLVVLAVGLGAVPHVCREIVARDARWRAMVDRVKTVATQSFQLWLKSDARALGWPHPTTAISGFVEPFDTWADMTHLIPREQWPEAPRGLAYFCSALPDLPRSAERGATDYPTAQREQVRRNAVAFLDAHVRHLWPGAADGSGAFRWELLVDPGVVPPATGPARFGSQFWKANVDPSDRYTLSVPGSSAYRLSPLDETYDNLTVAGDWTACGFNAGCVEAAVMSGRLAAHAIAGTPALEDIVGFDHP